MNSNEENLKSLETIFSEYFIATNEGKRQIESQLNAFRESNGAWKLALYFLKHTQNDNVKIYVLNVLEDTVNKQWMGVECDDKLTIRNDVNQYLLSRHQQVQSFIRNKLVKLAVDIGRQDWPHFYPDFLPSILQLAQHQDTCLLGVLLLEVVSQEINTQSDELSMLRKQELVFSLQEMVPSILEILNNILLSVMEKNHHPIAATPPPSPTSQSKSANYTPHSLSSSSPPYHDSLLPSMFASPAHGGHLAAAAAELDCTSRVLCSSALSCIANYFSWAPLSCIFSSHLLSTLLQYATFGCQVNSSSHSTSEAGSHLAVLSMSCINEVLSRNFVPAQFEDHLLQMLQQIFQLLRLVTKDVFMDTPGCDAVTKIDKEYVERFTEFLRLFVSTHLGRLASNNNFPMLEFLALLHKYTFHQQNVDVLLQCLDIWITFLDFISTSLQCRKQDKVPEDSILVRYERALQDLLRSVLDKVLFCSNQSQLEHLDNDVLGDDKATEWTHFLCPCLEVVAKVAELDPKIGFDYVWTKFDSLLERYLTLDRRIVSDTDGSRRLALSGEHESRILHCVLRDLSTLLQALGRLSHHFIGKHFLQLFSSTSYLVYKLVVVVEYGSRQKLYEVATESVLQQDLVTLQAEAMAALKANSSWMCQCISEASLPEEQREAACDMMCRSINSICPLFNKQVPDKVIHSAAHLLISLMTTVRPAFLFRLPSVKMLYEAVTLGACSMLSLDVQLLVYRSLSHYLILPWLGVPDKDQNWDGRSETHLEFVRCLVADYVTKAKASDLSDRSLMRRVLRVCEDLVCHVAGEVVTVKQLMYQSLNRTELITATLNVFQSSLADADVARDIMEFVLSLFRCLKMQMGVEFAGQIIDLFLDLFTRDGVVQNTQQSVSGGVTVLQIFLQLLEMVVLEPDKSFQPYLPRIISICVDHICPVIKHSPSPDVQLALFDVFGTLLLSKWRYFFPRTAVDALNGREDSVHHEHHLLVIFKAYAESFMQHDITLFKHNLDSLAMLQYKCCLYAKGFFRSKMLSDFMRILMEAFVSRSHDLLQEEIVGVVFGMAAVDFDLFHRDFIPHFLLCIPGLDETQRRLLAEGFRDVKDLPSFTHKMASFTNDIRYYRRLSSSMDLNSITF